MFTPYFTITPKITKELEAIGGAFGYLMAVRLPEEYKKELVSKITAETVHASTAIEGNTLTEKQVREVLLGKKVPAKEIDVTEVLNYNNALSYVERLAKKRSAIIRETHIKEINMIVLDHIRDDIAGNYRKKQVIVGDYLPPEYETVPHLMEKFVAWINNPKPPDLSPVLYSGIAHYQLVAIHPFEDGNGRTTRILTTLFLLCHDYDYTRFFSLESFYNRNRKSYYEALDSADKYRIQGQPDLTRWLEYYVEGMLIEAARARSRVEELLEKRPRRRETIWVSETEKTLLRLTAKKETAKAAEYVKVSALSRKGTYNALEKLVTAGLLKRIGERKGAYYQMTEKGREYVKEKL